MSYWLYQLNQKSWVPERYRLEIWENERWAWEVGKKQSKGVPSPGDVVVFFYAPASGNDPGFYGWAVVTEWAHSQLYFTPVSPSNQLKMHPWWDDRARALADAIRGKMTQATMWPMSVEQVRELRRGVTSWINGATE
jgi:hypothetical protein